MKKLHPCWKRMVNTSAKGGGICHVQFCGTRVTSCDKLRSMLIFILPECQISFITRLLYIYAHRNRLLPTIHTHFTNLESTIELKTMGKLCEPNKYILMAMLFKLLFFFSPCLPSTTLCH